MGSDGFLDIRAGVDAFCSVRKNNRRGATSPANPLLIIEKERLKERRGP
jgi:hypothetical protein